jgi:repressor LexA
MMEGANSAEAGRPGRGKVLTWRQRKVFQVIQEYVEANGCSPSNREIAQAAGLKSASTAHHHLEQLKAAGFVTYRAGSPRTVRVLRPGKQAPRPAEEPGETPGDTRQQAGRAPGDMDPQKVVWVPIAGQVAGGSPIPPLEPDQERFPLPREVVGGEEGLFILQVVGDSMTGAGIFSGDWVVVRELFDKPRNDDIVAALLDGIEVEGTVKTYKRVNRRVWLMPHNPAHTPIPGDKAIIRGKVVAVLRQV